MKFFDAIIVGAGPAGSTCAANLKKIGFNVKLFDKKVFPRVKPCAGWITPQVIEALQLDKDEYCRNNTFQPIRGFKTGVIAGRMVETRFEEPISFGIRRIEFDDYLLHRSGVLCDFQPVKTMVRKDREWHVNGEFCAPLIVGAGGHFCPVARWVREQNSTPNSQAATKKTKHELSGPTVVFAQEVEFELPAQQPNSIDPEIPELYFCNDFQGYGWCLRKGNHINIGLGRIDKSALSIHVQEFWDLLRSQHKVSSKLPSHFFGHAYRLYADEVPSLACEGILLVGDAAGLAYPHSGEGIRPAVESAIIAADVVEKAKGDFSADSLGEYERRIVNRLGRPKPYRAANWLPVAWLQTIATGLMATHWFARNVVVDNWFLHRKQGTLKI